MEDMRRYLAENDMNMRMTPRQKEMQPSCKNLIIGTHLIEEEKKKKKL